MLLRWKPLLRLLFLPSFTRGDGYLTWLLLLVMVWYVSRLNLKVKSILLYVLSITAMIVSSIALMQFVGIDLTNSGFSYYHRSWGTLANPDFLGGFLLLTLPISIVHLKWLSLLNVGGLITSGSRAAFLGGSITALWLMFQSRKNILIVCIVLGLIFLIHGAIIKNFSLDMNSRYFFWKTTIELVEQRPLFGYGPNTLLLKVPNAFTDSISEHHINRSFTYWDNPHNEILYISYTFGLVGLMGYVYVWYHVLSNAPTFIKVSLSSYAIWLMFDWSHIGVSNVFWLIVGMYWRKENAATRTNTN